MRRPSVAAHVAGGFAFLLALAGCAAPAGSPSLAPRPIERLSTAEPDAPAPPPPAVDPGADSRYAGIVTDARTGDAGFARELVPAKAAVAQARAAEPGSDPWTAAQLALTRLDAARAPTDAALAALEAERTGGAFDPAALAAAQDAVDTIDGRERGAVAALAAGLRKR